MSKSELLYQHVEANEPINTMKTNQRKKSNQSQDMDTRFFFRGSRACRHASPHCVDQHLVVQRLRGVAQTSSSLGHRKNLPTSEVAQ